MNKMIIGVLILAALAGGWFLFHGATTVDYVADVADEIDTLESDLAALEVEANAGTLTPAAAAAAQAKIATRIDAINAALATADETGLTSAQRKQLLAALTKLKGLFITYRSVLTVVDETAAELPEAERRIYYSKGSGTHVGVTALVASVIETVETAAEDAIAGYEPEDTTPEEVTPEEFEEIVEVTVEDAMRAEDTVVDDMGTSTEEVINDTEMEDTGDVDEAMGGDVMEDMPVEVDTEAEVEVEAEAEATTTN